MSKIINYFYLFLSFIYMEINSVYSFSVWLFFAQFCICKIRFLHRKQLHFFTPIMV